MKLFFSLIGKLHTHPVGTSISTLLLQVEEALCELELIGKNFIY